MIICVVGPSCAGKTTSAQYIQDKTGIPVIEASDSVEQRRDANAPDVPLTTFAEERLAKEGKETFARNVADIIENCQSQHVIISGFRTIEEYNYIQEEYHDTRIRLYGLYANSLLRFQRKKHRDNPGSEYSYKDFIQKDFKEYQFGVTDLMENVSNIIINESTFQALYNRLDEQIPSQFM